jgi:hypothetical protein
MDYQNSTNGQYDFILNPPPAPKRQILKVPGDDPFLRKVFIGIGGVVIFMIVVVILTAIFGGGSSSSSTLLSLAQSQQEIARVASAGASGATGQDVKNMAITTRITMYTQQQQTLQLLKDAGVSKVGEKQLALKRNANTDQQLTVGKETSTYDTVFTTIMKQSLQDYAFTVKQLSGASKSATQSELFSAYYEQTQLILGQIKPTK